MAFSISRLFHQKHSASDGLTQPQREAVADLLHYCMYADNHIALAETKMISDVVSTFGWEPNISFESFEARSIGAARAAKEDVAARKTFLDSIKQRLNTPGSRDMALSSCKKLFNSDGVSPKETALLAEITRLIS